MYCGPYCEHFQQFWPLDLSGWELSPLITNREITKSIIYSDFRIRVETYVVVIKRSLGEEPYSLKIDHI